MASCGCPGSRAALLFVRSDRSYHAVHRTPVPACSGPNGASE
jgi:hypothetical protein